MHLHLTKVVEQEHAGQGQAGPLWTWSKEKFRSRVKLTDENVLGSAGCPWAHGPSLYSFFSFFKYIFCKILHMEKHGKVY